MRSRPELSSLKRSSASGKGKESKNMLLEILRDCQNGLQEVSVIRLSPHPPRRFDFSQQSITGCKYPARPLRTSSITTEVEAILPLEQCSRLKRLRETSDARILELLTNFYPTSLV